VQILGVSLDTVADNAAFARHHRFPFALLSDTNRAICTAYDACTDAQAQPMTRLTYIVGPDGRILYVIHNVNAPEHPVAALRYLYRFRNPTGYVEGALVYSLGTLGYDFGTTVYRDFLTAAMRPADPSVARYLLSYLDDHPTDAADLIWTLNLNQTPIYAIRPAGAFTVEAYREIREFLTAHLVDGVERISVPGVMQGTVKLLSGQIVPVLQPAIPGMFSWTTEALLQAIQSEADNAQTLLVIRNFLDQVYDEHPNLGESSRERAINYAATNVYQAQLAIRAAVQENMLLQQIDAEPSVICRPDTDCWDVLLTFADPSKRLRQAQKRYRFTIDVSDIIPVPIGRVRSWYIYADPRPAPICRVR
jgi:cyanobactin maturation PatA/PatG family protease